MDRAYPRERRDAAGDPGRRRARSCCRPVRPLHDCVPVDLFVPGCPPPADAIWYVLSELIEGRMPDPATVTRFGA